MTLPRHHLLTWAFHLYIQTPRLVSWCLPANLPPPYTHTHNFNLWCLQLNRWLTFTNPMSGKIVFIFTCIHWSFRYDINCSLIVLSLFIHHLFSKWHKLYQDFYSIWIVVLFICLMLLRSFFKIFRWCSISILLSMIWIFYFINVYNSVCIDNLFLYLTVTRSIMSRTHDLHI